jgi:hypothetical protein
MSPTMAALVDWVEAVGNLHFPSKRTVAFKN